MGKILTPSEFADKRLPDIDLRAFDRVARSFERRMTNAPSIVGALLYGSALYRHFTMLSDVDCVVLYLPRHRSHALKVVQGWVEYAHSKHIKASPIFVDVTVAQNGLHSFTPLFWDHLQGAARIWKGYIKQNPLLWFAPPLRDGELSLKEIELNYFRFKLASLDKALVRWPVLDESGRFRFLQKALEAPMHGARKVLTLQGFYRKTSYPAPDSKDETMRAYEKHMPKHMAEMLCQINYAGCIYITELYGQISQPRGRGQDELDYQATLEKYLKYVPMAIEFVRLNALYVAREL